ncbi:MAG TPA: CoA transferase subunit A [Bacteroidales bacterium]|nr:CoA transferase subunit A [Bacteroidales bacterium]
MSKFITKEQAVEKIHDGMSIMVGGFLVVGTPTSIIDELVKKGVKDITLIVNDSAFIDRGIGILIAKKMVKKVITSYIGSNPACIEQYNNKELEVEFVPQGTLAERIRCGGAGLGGFLTPTGLGTIVEEGKQRITVDGKDYLLEKALRADIALIGASISDEEGNLFYKGTTQNFNPLMSTAANIVIAEAKEVIKTGELPIENIHTPAIFVDFLVKA